METFRTRYELAYKKMQEDFLGSFRGGIPKIPLIASYLAEYIGLCLSNHTPRKLAQMCTFLSTQKNTS